jgi:hypothetical protein
MRREVLLLLFPGSEFNPNLTSRPYGYRGRPCSVAGAANGTFLRSGMVPFNFSYVRAEALHGFNFEGDVAFQTSP